MLNLAIDYFRCAIFVTNILLLWVFLLEGIPVCFLFNKHESEIVS